MDIQIILPLAFDAEHQHIILRYVQEETRFTAADWATAIEAFDLLKQAVAVTLTRRVSFPEVYAEQIEAQHGQEFVNGLQGLRNIGREVAPLWANVARHIPETLRQAGFYDPQVPASRLLLVYCWYWWRAFAKGYAFEVQVFRDLEHAGIDFEAHDLTTRAGRFTPYDLIVLGFKGDIKTSTYFLQAERSSDLALEFYITRIRGKSGRVHTMVVFMRDNMWQVIDGETLRALLADVIDVLPHPARVRHEAGELVVVDYDWWKERVLLRQKRQEDKK